MSKPLEKENTRREVILIPEKLERVIDLISNKCTEETVRVDDKNNLNKNDGDKYFCDFETAIAATGYGKFNILILVLSVCPLMSCLVTTSTMSLILPQAECDLELTNFNKGLLNAITYVGMIISAFAWGFLCDTMGRQKLLVISFGLESVLAVIVGLAQTYWVLVAAKFVDGFIIAGPYAILMTYLAEVHSAEHRAKTIQWTGVFSGVGTITMPMLAWAVIPSSIKVEGLILLPSWRIFLLICAIPAILSAIGFTFVRESPKFLMSHGRNEEALEALKVIYSMNYGLPKNDYPLIFTHMTAVLLNAFAFTDKSRFIVKSLIIEKLIDKKLENEPKSLLRYFNLGWLQIKPLFKSPHLVYALLIFTIQFCGLFGLNTIRLWMPQLFSSIIDIENAASNTNTFFSNVCEILHQTTSNVTIVLNDCLEYHVNSQVYINSTLIGLATAVGYFLSGFVVKRIGKKWLIIACSTIGALCSGTMYWAINSLVILILSSVFVTLISISTTALVAIVVDLFPTSLRSMAVSLTMMFGRIGAMVGNLCFPILIDWSCAVPFFLIAAVVFVAGIITFGLPKTKGKALE